MKTKTQQIKMLLITIAFSVVAHFINAQPWLTTGNPLAGPGNILGPAAAGIPLNFFTAGTQKMILTSGGNLGINTIAPNQLLTVNAGNINANTPTNGYMIGNTFVLWHNNIPSNIYVGVGAGNAGSFGTGNTFVGSNAGNSNTSGGQNCFVGNQAGQSNTAGTQNTFIGDESGTNLNTGNNNTFVGHQSGFNQVSGSGNTYLGSHAAFGQAGSTGNSNTILGAAAGPNILTGDDNVYIGEVAAQLIPNGFRNVFIGKLSGRGTSLSGNGTDNVFVGFATAIFNNTGSFNVAMGRRAANAFDLGKHSIFIGDDCDQSVAGLNDATVIGSNAIVTANDKFILGNNNQWVGIGLSNDPSPNFGPQSSLEINARTLGTGAIIPNASGLKFRQLTANTTPVPNQGNQGFLALDASGNVIYVPGGLANLFCNNPSHVLPVGTNAGVGLNGNNFYFEDGPATGANGVFLGSGVCGNQLVAKLTVRNTNQKYGIIATTGLGSKGPLYGIYTSASGGSTNFGIYTSAFSAGQSIGIYSTLTGASPLNVGNLAGYFDGGDVFNTGGTQAQGYFVTSDSRLKKDTSVFTSGLGIIRDIHPVSYKFNGKAGLDTTRKYIGVIAENILQIAPYAVDTFFSKLDSADTQATALLRVNNEAIMYTAVNAIKQLDSTLTKATSVPGAPVLISPADGAADDFRAVAFTWHSVSAAVVLYRAQVAADNGFTNIVRDQSGISDTTISFGFCDSITTTYYWRINAKNNAGTGAWSQIFSFTDTAKCLGIVPEPIGTKTGVGFLSSSDSRMKTNVAPLTSALAQVNALNGIYYNWIPTPGYVFDSAQQIGFIADSVQKIVPQVVHTDKNGYLTLDYGRLVPVLVQAIKEQQATITSQQSAIGNLQTAVSNCCSSTSKLQTPNSLPSSDADLASASAILWQNFPNPFGDGTVIRYFVPEKSASATIVFTDEFGNEVKTAALPYKGIKSELNLSTSNLAAGIYSYSLVVDGKIADTKKMLKSK